jgi:predicted ATPase
MLTRLEVNGFKNLINADISFGPFTAIAGVNGVGKSNLFDAIVFLSALAERPLTEAAKSVRDENHRSTDIRSLFLKLGDTHIEEMSFAVEMLVPASGSDDLGQVAKATITFLRYELVLRYRRDQEHPSSERLEVIREHLRHINVGEAHKHLGFPHSSIWRKSVVGGRRTGDLLSTEGEGKDRRVKLHQDGRSGKPREYLASSLPRTVLSSTNAVESPTALLARREMQSWRLLQLEPSSLRNSDSFHAATHVGVDGSHLAATLHHLSRIEGGNGDASAGPAAVYSRVANQLAGLVEDVHEVRVDVDQQRELLTLQVVDSERNVHAARALSDGTLRFLALAILKMDPEARGLLCFEEPENGIHPERISRMLDLLKDLAVDSQNSVDVDNPLRQVVVNTHSPAVVGLVEDDDLLVAEPREVLVEGKLCRGVVFSWLSDTWRHRMQPQVRTVSRGVLGAYLNPLAFADDTSVTQGGGQKKPHTRRVKDRDDLQTLLPFPDEE